MKISEIEKLTIDEILQKFEFTPSFIEEFKQWCKAQSRDHRNTHDEIQQLMNQQNIVGQLAVLASQNQNQIAQNYSQTSHSVPPSTLPPGGKK